MTAARDLSTELLGRIDADIEHFGGTLPERASIAWRGYLAAMLEWDLIPATQYDALIARLPSVPDDPAVGILLGRDAPPSAESDAARRTPDTSPSARSAVSRR